MNKQAFTLLQELYGLVRDGTSAVTYQSMSQYRSALLKEISARIKTAVGPQVEPPTQVQARSADEGEQVEVGVFNQDGELLHLKSLSVYESRVFIREIEESISEVITRSTSATLDSGTPSP